MKNRNIVNAGLVVAVFVLLGFFAFCVRIRSTADFVAVLKTTGITCGKCSAAIEKALQAGKGVASVEVDSAGGRVVVGYDSKKARPEELAAVITREGYDSAVLQVLSAERYRAVTGRSIPRQGAQSGSCGCYKNKD